MLVRLPILKYFDILRSKEASKDPTRVIVPIAPSEFKVYDYLVERVACNQTREHINEFLERCKKYKLAKAEIIEQSEKPFRLKELLNLVIDVLPELPAQNNAEEVSNEDKEETTDGENMYEDEQETANHEQIDEDETEQTEDGEQMEIS